MKNIIAELNRIIVDVDKLKEGPKPIEDKEMKKLVKQKKKKIESKI